MVVTPFRCQLHVANVIQLMNLRVNSVCELMGSTLSCAAVAADEMTSDRLDRRDDVHEGFMS